MDSPSFPLVPFAESALEIEITGAIHFENDLIHVRYQISGATERIKFAAPVAQTARKNELWRTTCFELFLKLPGRKEYWEYNLSPSGDWNVYRFKSYRSELKQEAEITDISIDTASVQGRLTQVRAVLPLSPLLLDRRLDIGLSSVIEDTAGNVHYFALHHNLVGGAKPDFHDPAGFVLSLDPA